MNMMESIWNVRNFPKILFSDNTLCIFGFPNKSYLFTGGKTGVFEIEDLVTLLQRENAKDIFVATVPSNIRYVDYICIVSARSKRHIHAIAEFVRRVYKKKCHKRDLIPKIEGKDSEEWMALDLGIYNKAVHYLLPILHTY